MTHFKKILFPVEFSQRDEAAAPFVLSMAQRYRAQIALLHVFRPTEPIYLGMDGVYPDAFETSAAVPQLHSKLRDFAAAQLPKTDAECVFENGDPAETICRYAADNGMDLIAMPTHGYGLFRRMLLGSVTAKVLHDSAIPVWTSAHAPEPSHRAHPQPRRIICAVDMQPESRHTLEVAISLAKDAGANLELVHVPAETVSEQAAEQHMKELLAHTGDSGLVDVRELPWLPVIPQGKPGNIAEGVRGIALRTRADLIVIGRGAIQTTLGRLTSHSYDIIRESPCPVLSV